MGIKQMNPETLLGKQVIAIDDMNPTVPYFYMTVARIERGTAYSKAGQWANLDSIVSDPAKQQAFIEEMDRIETETIRAKAKAARLALQ